MTTIDHVLETDLVRNPRNPYLRRCLTKWRTLPETTRAKVYAVVLRHTQACRAIGVRPDPAVIHEVIWDIGSRFDATAADAS